MTDTKEIFRNWLIHPKDNGDVSTSLTADRYVGDINRLSKRLYGYIDWNLLSNELYILKLLFMNSSNWILLDNEDVDLVINYLYRYKLKNRNFNDHYNHFFHSLRKQLNIPSSDAAKHTDFFFTHLKNTNEYAKLFDWVKHVFVTEKSIKYLSWLYINKIEKRNTYTALSKFSEYLINTQTVNENFAYALSKQTTWIKIKNKSNSNIQIEEASGTVGRNFYARYKEGKAEKVLSVQETALALGCGETTIRRLLKNKKINFKANNNKIAVDNVRRFLKRRHTKRSHGSVTPIVSVQDKTNWVKMKEAEIISHRSATYILERAKKGYIAYTRYGLRKFLYFKPDLLKTKP